MAHRAFEFDEIYGVTQAWHGLSRLFPKGIKLPEIWLNKWEYETHALTLENGKPTPFSTLTFNADGRQIFVGAPFNPDTFVPILNSDFIKLIEESISGTAHEIESFGSVRNRGRVFVSIRLKGLETFKAAGREFSSFLNYGNGNDKSSVLWVNTSNICTVCDNTFGFNLAQVENKRANASQMDDLKMSTKHTKNVKLKLPEFARIIDRAIGVQAEFQIELDKAAQITVTTEKAERIFTGFVGRNLREDVALSTRSQNAVKALVESFTAGRGNHGENGADLFSAVTDYYTHASSGGDDRMKQFVSSEFGSGAERKGEFWGIVRDTEKLAATERHGEKLLLATHKAN